MKPVLGLPVLPCPWKLFEFVVETAEFELNLEGACFKQEKSQNCMCRVFSSFHQGVD